MKALASLFSRPSPKFQRVTDRQNRFQSTASTTKQKSFTRWTTEEYLICLDHVARGRSHREIAERYLPQKTASAIKTRMHWLLHSPSPRAVAARSPLSQDSTPWTPHEDQICLNERLDGLSYGAIVERHLPHRTLAAVFLRIRQLAQSSSPLAEDARSVMEQEASRKFTPREIRICINGRSRGLSFREIAERHLPHRNVPGIMNEMSRVARGSSPLAEAVRLSKTRASRQWVLQEEQTLVEQRIKGVSYTDITQLHLPRRTPSTLASRLSYLASKPGPLSELAASLVRPATSSLDERQKLRIRDMASRGKTLLDITQELGNPHKPLDYATYYTHYSRVMRGKSPRRSARFPLAEDARLLGLFWKSPLPTARHKLVSRRLSPRSRTEAPTARTGSRRGRLSSWSAAELQRLHDLHLSGKSDAAIAVEMGRKQANLSQILKRILYFVSAHGVTAGVIPLDLCNVLLTRTRRPWTVVEEQRLVELVEQGHGLTHMLAVLGRPVDSINQKLRMMKLVRGRRDQRWTPEEKKKLVDLTNEGQPMDEIARELDRTVFAIQNQQTLAGLAKRKIAQGRNQSTKRAQEFVG